MSFFVRDPQSKNDVQAIKARQEQVQAQWKNTECVQLFAVDEVLAQANARNCENMVGAIAVPVGLAGPVVMHDGEDQSQSREYMLPLATTEGALIASVSRGVKSINANGGALSSAVQRGMSRAPAFVFPDGIQARKFTRYLDDLAVQAQIATISQTTSKHLRFISLQHFVRGRHVFVRFVFDPDQAMGMNMVTIAVDHIWQELLSRYPNITMTALSGNVCTDKKIAAINQILGRGIQAQAEVFLSETSIESILGTSSQAILDTHYSKNILGSNVAGSLSQHMHFANVVAAFYIATGQDVAHVVEASQGSTVVEKTDQGLYVAVDLPTLPLGVVGGGTYLPTQSQARNLISRSGAQLSVLTLAQVLAVGVLAAEISGLAALSTHSLAQAHQTMARPRQEI